MRARQWCRKCVYITPDALYMKLSWRTYGYIQTLRTRAKTGIKGLLCTVRTVQYYVKFGWPRVNCPLYLLFMSTPDGRLRLSARRLAILHCTDIAPTCVAGWVLCLGMCVPVCLRSNVRDSHILTPPPPPPPIRTDSNHSAHWYIYLIRRIEINRNWIESSLQKSFTCWQMIIRFVWCIESNGTEKIAFRSAPPPHFFLFVALLYSFHNFANSFKVILYIVGSMKSLVCPRTPIYIYLEDNKRKLHCQLCPTANQKSVFRATGRIDPRQPPSRVQILVQCTLYTVHDSSSLLDTTQ